MKSLTINLRAARAEIRAWRAAAEADGRTLSGWIRYVLNMAVAK